MDNLPIVQDELLLLHRARSLESEALAEIHDTYYVPIFRYIAMRVGDHATAEDLASDVFIRLLDALRDKTAPQKTLRGWLFAVASRVVKDHFRQRYRRQLTHLDESLASEAIGPDRVVEMKLTHEVLHAALGELTEEQQNVLALRFGYEMSIREVAETMGKSEGAVKMLQARAVAMLSRTMYPGTATT